MLITRSAPNAPLLLAIVRIALGFENEAYELGFVDVADAAGDLAMAFSMNDDYAIRTEFARFEALIPEGEILPAGLRRTANEIYFAYRILLRRYRFEATYVRPYFRTAATA